MNSGRLTSDVSVSDAKGLDDFVTSASITGKVMPDFEVLDSQIPKKDATRLLLRTTANKLPRKRGSTHASQILDWIPDCLADLQKASERIEKVTSVSSSVI